ncbi:MAG: septum formation protein Maf [Prevotella sp.]|nr:septum formation protein Maf [Prevotella sp.]
MLEHLSKYRIILASQSPRRRELLAGLGFPFEVHVLPDVSESFPDDLPVSQTAEYIAVEKAAAYRSLLKDNDLVITADTVVICGQQVLGKPHDADDACRMLRMLSGRTHQVITGVCIMTKSRQRRFSVSTDVTFKELSDDEISYYVNEYHPMDKAGAYGIQEWIGYIGVTQLNGSYFNVMGLPVQRIYEELRKNFF